MKKYRLEGLDCADCGIKLENALSKKEYVKDVSISFATKTMIITTTNIEQVKKDIKSIEPEVEIIQRMLPDQRRKTTSIQENVKRKISDHKEMKTHTSK